MIKMADFTKSWNRSTQVRKQRKYRHNAPLHLRQKMMSVHFSPILRKKYGRRNLQVRVGDRVKVMRGQFAKKEGIVERVNLKLEKIYVTGLETIKKDGTKAMISLTPSNVMIIELELNDKKRKGKLGLSLKQLSKETIKQTNETTIKLKKE